MIITGIQDAQTPFADILSTAQIARGKMGAVGLA
jgi:hypothetical protein